MYSVNRTCVRLSTGFVFFVSLALRTAERNRRLIRGRPASNVQNHPDIRKLKVPRRVAVTEAQNVSAEDLFVVTSRSLDVGDGEKIRDADPLSKGCTSSKLRASIAKRNEEDSCPRFSRFT